MSRVLIIDDNDAMRDGMAVALQKEGYDVAAIRSGLEGISAYKKKSFDAVVTDLRMEPIGGLEVVKQLRAFDPDAVVLVVTAYGTIETAVAAMQEGAYDFITKPFAPDVLRLKVQRALELSSTRRRVHRLQAHNEALEHDVLATVGSLVGSSEPMQRLLGFVRRAAATDTTVFIAGESGTGKELVARMIHDVSPRKHGPFVVVHCASLAETLLESELFGHERGAFTGAVKRKLGRFELADRGTVFLDEIGEISSSVQTKLLRVLQEKEIQRVGGEETIRADVRVVSATNRNLAEEVKHNRFREDLYYRLHIIPVQVPPLRERVEDIPDLVRHFIAKHGPKVNRRVIGVTDAALHRLKQHRWPGNVRELENVIEQALVFAEGEQLGVADLPGTFSAAATGGHSVPVLPSPQGDRSLPQILDDLERELIEQAFEKTGRVKTETARLLGIKTSALYYKLEKYGLIEKGNAADPES